MEAHISFGIAPAVDGNSEPTFDCLPSPHAFRCVGNQTTENWMAILLNGERK